MDELISLLSKFSVGEFLILLITIALALKGIITFFDWVRERVVAAYNKKFNKDTEKTRLEKRLQGFEDEEKEQNEKITNIVQSMEKIQESIKLLIHSDKEDIKSFITKEHHYFCYNQKWIDDYSLDCIEQRYEIYTKEHGNTFIEALMRDLRALPRVPYNVEKEGE